MLVAPRWLNEKRCPQPGRLIGKRELEEGGPHALRFTGGGIDVRRSYAAGDTRRLWQPAPIEEEE